MPPNPDYSRVPEGYYFFVQMNRDANQMGDANFTEVSFTSASYFDRERAQSDWHVTDYIGDFLDTHGLQEEMEGVCSTEMSPPTIRLALLGAGFRENAEFTRMMVAMGGAASAEPPVYDDDDDEVVDPGMVDRRPTIREDRGPLPTMPSEPLHRPNIFDRINDETPPENRPEPEKVTAYDRLLKDEVVDTEETRIPPTTIEIGLIEEDPRKVSMTCEGCGKPAVYTLKAAKRILGCCESTGCLKPLIPKIEQWAHEAQSKSWDLLSDDSMIPEKPKLTLREEIRKFQKEQGIPETGELTSETEAALRKCGRVGMISIWRNKLREENSPPV